MVSGVDVSSVGMPSAGDPPPQAVMRILIKSIVYHIDERRFTDFLLNFNCSIMMQLNLRQPQMKFV